MTLVSSSRSLSSRLGGSDGASGGSSGASVERKRSASGPSLMLALLRRAMAQDLLGELPVVVRGVRLGIVLQDAGTAHRCLGELDCLANPGLEDQVAEV